MVAPNLASADFQAAAQGLLPRGKAWPRDLTRTLSNLLLALADTLQAHAARAANLLIDAFPATTDELLPEWQETLGLPDPAWPSATTLEQQQNQVVIKLAGTGGQSVPFFTGLAAQFGETVTIDEHAPFRCGQSKCGQTVGTTDQFFCFDVIAPDTALQGVFDQLKPAHTICTVKT